MTAMPDLVLFYVLVLVSVCLLWFWVRDRPDSSAYRWAAPRVAAMRVWIARAPATFTYMAIWTATSIIMQGQPITISELVARYASTNLFNFRGEPFRTMVASSFLVAENGLFYLLYVVVFVAIVARLEHRIGAARWIAVAVASHVGGSLVILGLERVGIVSDVLPATIAVTEDIGVSYVMAGAMCAYAWLATWRWPYAALLVVGLVVPLAVVPGLGSAGHFIAGLLGLAVGRFVLRWPLRPRLVWRDLRSEAAVDARPTP